MGFFIVSHTKKQLKIQNSLKNTISRGCVYKYTGRPGGPSLPPLRLYLFINDLQSRISAKVECIIYIKTSAFLRRIKGFRGPQNWSVLSCYGWWPILIATDLHILRTCARLFTFLTISFQISNLQLVQPSQAVECLSIVIENSPNTAQRKPRTVPGL